MAHNVLHDIFPTYVAFLPASDPLPVDQLRSAPPSPNSHQVSTARVIVTDQRVIIAIDGDNSASVIMNEAYVPDSYQKAKNASKDDSYLVTVSGTKVAYRRDDNCGCGSRLRSWNAYQIVNSAND